MKLEIGDVVYFESKWITPNYGIGIIDAVYERLYDVKTEPNTFFLVEEPILISKGDFKFEKGDVVYINSWDQLAIITTDFRFITVDGLESHPVDDGIVSVARLCILPTDLTLISKGDFK